MQRVNASTARSFLFESLWEGHIILRATGIDSHVCMWHVCASRVPAVPWKQNVEKLGNKKNNQSLNCDHFFISLFDHQTANPILYPLHKTVEGFPSESGLVRVGGGGVSATNGKQVCGRDTSSFVQQESTAM